MSKMSHRWTLLDTGGLVQKDELTCRKSLSTRVTQMSSGCKRQLHPDGMKMTSVETEDRARLKFFVP